MTRNVHVLHVDDDPEYTALVAEFLERKREAFSVRTESDPEVVVDRLDVERIDCVVCDYEMPDHDGVSLLDDIRAEYPDLPVILYTGQGSEAVASDAINAGVTDYLQKSSGSDHYAVLANRIENAVEAYRATRALQNERDRFEALFGAFPEPTLSYTLAVDGPIIESVNDAFERVFGVDREAAVGEPVDDLIVGPEHRSEADRLNEAVRAGERLDADVEREAADGMRQFRIRNIPVAAEENSDGFAVYVDVTELERERTRFRAFLEHSTDVITVLDAEGVNRYVSPSVERVLGYDPEELVGETALRYVHPDDRDRIESVLADAVENPEQTHTAEYRFRHRDGSWVWVSSVGNAQFDNPAVEGLVVNSRDVSDRKRREEMLTGLLEATRGFMNVEHPAKVADRAVETATEILDLPVSSVWFHSDSDTLEPLAVSEAAKDVIGDAAASLGEEDLIQEAFADSEMKVVDDVGGRSDRIAEETPVESELVFPLGDHGVLCIGTTDAEGFDDNDVLLGEMLATVTEVAFDRAARAATLQEREAALHREKERLEEFASILAHDFRNPLNVANGHLELARNTEFDPDAEDSLARVADAHDQMDRLVDDMLTMARGGTAVERTEAVSLATVADRAWRAVEADDATLRVPTEGDGSDVEVEADPDRLRQLLENLFRNAVEHGGEDVTVELTALEDGFAVSDDGPGIPPDRREKVFESGHSTRDGGTGFGLAIVRQIAEAHDWTLSVGESEAGGARLAVSGVDISSDGPRDSARDAA
ncbi:MAG: PAS domain S-box protein [Halolamina sp.]